MALPDNYARVGGLYSVGGATLDTGVLPSLYGSGNPSITITAQRPAENYGGILIGYYGPYLASNLFKVTPFIHLDDDGLAPYFIPGTSFKYTSVQYDSGSLTTSTWGIYDLDGNLLVSGTIKGGKIYDSLDTQIGEYQSGSGSSSNYLSFTVPDYEGKGYLFKSNVYDFYAPLLTHNTYTYDLTEKLKNTTGDIKTMRILYTNIGWVNEDYSDWTINLQSDGSLIDTNGRSCGNFDSETKILTINNAPYGIYNQRPVTYDILHNSYQNWSRFTTLITTTQNNWQIYGIGYLVTGESSSSGGEENVIIPTSIKPGDIYTIKITTSGLFINDEKFISIGLLKQDTTSMSTSIAIGGSWRSKYADKSAATMYSGYATDRRYCNPYRGETILSIDISDPTHSYTMNLIPVKNISDDEYGWWDEVSSTYYAAKSGDLPILSSESVGWYLTEPYFTISKIYIKKDNSTCIPINKTSIKAEDGTLYEFSRSLVKGGE